MKSISGYTYATHVWSRVWFNTFVEILKPPMVKTIVVQKHPAFITLLTGPSTFFEWDWDWVGGLGDGDRVTTHSPNLVLFSRFHFLTVGSGSVRSRSNNITRVTVCVDCTQTHHITSQITMEKGKIQYFSREIFYLPDWWTMIKQDIRRYIYIKHPWIPSIFVLFVFSPWGSGYVFPRWAVTWF